MLEARKFPVSLSATFILVIFLFAIIFASTSNFVSSQINETQVTGLINSDATWTLANSPYNLTGPVTVNSGVILTIQAGVAVYFNGYSLQINGTLNARGNSTNEIFLICNGSSGNTSPIIFAGSSVDWNEQTNSGSIIQNAIVNTTGVDEISIQGSSPKIDNNTIISGSYDESQAIIVDGGSPIISNNIIISNSGSLFWPAVELSNSTSLVTNNMIYANARSVGFLGENYGSAIFVHDDSTIDGNLILQSGQGITFFSYGSPVTPVIENNNIFENSIGVEVGGSLSMFNNNIQNNSFYNVQSETPVNVDATYNWWGTTSYQAINQTIYDFKNDVNVGNVTFAPFLSSPNTLAPIFVNASAGAGGFIVPNGFIKANYGSKQTFNITASSGYHVSDVLVNGVSVGAATSYSIQNINGTTQISAAFSPNPTPTPTSSPTPSPSPNPTPTPTPSPTSTPTVSPTNSPTQTPIPKPSESPTPSPSPTPPVPEFPFLAIPLLLSLLTVAAFLTHEKKQEYTEN